MLSCGEYKLLDDSLKAQMLWLDGVFLLARRIKNRKAELFSLYDFYVEIFFEENDEPFFIKPFKNIYRMDVYLNAINIEDIFEKTKY